MTQSLQPPDADRPPVLAYATPVSKRQISKPLRTRLAPEPSADGPGFAEISDDKLSAIGAIIFCSLTMLALGSNWLPAFRSVINGGFHRRGTEMVIVGLLLLGQLTAMIFVFNQVWRRTLLVIRDGLLVLETTSPLGSRRREWPLADVVEVRAWVTAGANQSIEPLCELQIHTRGDPIVRLFRNYGQRELEWVARAFMSVILPEAAGPEA